MSKKYNKEVIEMKIDKYQGFVFEGRGYIKDHQMCREVITFDFPMVDSEKAKECLQLCLDFLSLEGKMFNKSTYDEVQSIYDYFIEIGRVTDAALIYNLAKKMGLLLNKPDSGEEGDDIEI